MSDDVGEALREARQHVEAALQTAGPPAPAHADVSLADTSPALASLETIVAERDGNGAAAPVATATLLHLYDRLVGAEATLQAERERAARERAELERRVLERDRAVQARDELLAIAGHELRNPISPLFLQVRALLLSVRAAKDGKVEASWLAPRLESFEHRMHRFLEVLDRILDVSRLGSGRVDLLLAPVDLTDVVRDIAERFERDAAAARSDLRVESISGPIVGMWDRLRLEQITANLLSNAVRYGAGQPIHVATRAAGQVAVLEVTDRGIGIAAEDHARIFERFERAGHRPTHGGFGVGLWVVRNLCNALGGSVTVDSAPNAGARFTVTLPLGSTPET
ncbi:MAG: HAMP domain-containing sensor histidine kinase [Polyangiales bacterium]